VTTAGAGRTAAAAAGAVLDRQRRRLWALYRERGRGPHRHRSPRSKW